MCYTVLGRRLCDLREGVNVCLKLDPESILLLLVHQTSPSLPARQAFSTQSALNQHSGTVRPHARVGFSRAEWR
jgi:hypothetical protein